MIKLGTRLGLVNKRGNAAPIPPPVSNKRITRANLVRITRTGDTRIVR